MTPAAKAPRPRQGVVAVIVQDSRYLVIRRSQHVRAPGHRGVHRTPPAGGGRSGGGGGSMNGAEKRPSRDALGRAHQGAEDTPAGHARGQRTDQIGLSG